MEETGNGGDTVMKVLLISANITVSPYPVYPLGLSVVAYALTRAGHEVRQYDALQEDNSLDALEKELEQFKPGLVGISVRNIDNVNLMNEQYYIENVKNIVAKVKSVSPVNVVLGGAGFSLIPDLILKETGADYGIVGEAESLVVEFAERAARGEYPAERIVGPGQKLVQDEIAAALYDDRVMEYYLKSGNIASIQSKRGCTHACVYCSYPVLEGSAIRQRNPRSVVDDMQLLHTTHKAKLIFFVDSVFNDDEGAYLELVREMLNRKVKIPWTGFFKPKGLTDAVVKQMKETGLIAVEIGSDAACDTTLKRLGKSFTFRDIIETSDLFVENGVATSHYFMFGGPGETRETVFEGIENVKGLAKCVKFIFMGIRILPNTPLARLAIREKVIARDDGLLKPTYYISPSIDKEWLEQTLTEAFAGTRDCVFPPDAVDNSLRVLHKLGYTGTLWELLLPEKDAGRKGRRRHAPK
jgi:lipid biosynthesis B12-binding/radical SAM protein